MRRGEASEGIFEISLQCSFTHVAVEVQGSLAHKWLNLSPDSHLPPGGGDPQRQAPPSEVLIPPLESAQNPPLLQPDKGRGSGKVTLKSVPTGSDLEHLSRKSSSSKGSCSLDQKDDGNQMGG